MKLPSPVMGGNDAAGRLLRLGRRASPEQQEDARSRDVESDQRVVLEEAPKAEDAVIERRRTR